MDAVLLVNGGGGIHRCIVHVTVVWITEYQVNLDEKNLQNKFVKTFDK